MNFNKFIKEFNSQIMDEIKAGAVGNVDISSDELKWALIQLVKALQKTYKKVNTDDIKENDYVLCWEDTYLLVSGDITAVIGKYQGRCEFDETKHYVLIKDNVEIVSNIAKVHYNE